MIFCTKCGEPLPIASAMINNVSAENQRLKNNLEAGAVVHMSKSHLAYLIAEARAEALKEAADRAVKFCHVIFPWGSDGSHAENLRAAITGDQP
jgi:hypothetical protein